MAKRNIAKDMVTQTFTFFDYEALDAAALGEALLDLTPSQATMGSYSGQLYNFLDMYRFARIEKLTIEAQMDVNSTAYYSGWFLGFVPPGASAPTNLLLWETRHVSELASGNVANSCNRAKLTMNRSDFTVLAEAGGPGPGWIPTASDGPATTFGSIYIFTTVPAGTGAPSISQKVTLTMSFYQLVDPSLLSDRVRLRSAFLGNPRPKKRIYPTLTIGPCSDATQVPPDVGDIEDLPTVAQCNNCPRRLSVIERCCHKH